MPTRKFSRRYLLTRRRALLALVLPVLVSAAGPAFRIRVEVQSPAGRPFAVTAQSLCEKWFPKINAALFDPQTPLPYAEVRVVFLPEIENGGTVIPAFARDNTIYVNSAYVADVHKYDPSDFSGMLVHELTHINQHYPENAGPGWLVEGIADYVRHKYFAKDIEPRLHLDANGNLTGFELDRNKGDFANHGYTAGYTVTGAFLLWLEQAKDKDLVPVINRALRDHRYSPKLFQDLCGSPVESLWREFVAQSRAPRP